MNSSQTIKNEKLFYKADISYLINVYLREYDIEKANISALYELGVLNEEQYKAYYSMPKHDREVEIGCYLKYRPNLLPLLQSKILEFRNMFISSNNIDENQILYLDNDSITIIDPKSKTQDDRISHFGTHINFKLKNVYTSYYKLGSVDLLYNSNNESFRVKYAGQKLIDRHKDTFLDFLLALCYEAETSNLSNVLLMLKGFYTQYIQYQLPVNFYREFNQNSKFKLKSGLAFTYYSDIMTDIQTDQIDISYNANLLRNLVKIFSYEYFKY